MEQRIFRSRLERAIEAELVFQAAKVRGVELTEAQQARLERIGPGHEANLEELKGYGLSWDTVSAEQVGLERRLTEAMLLRQNLVASGDELGPSPDRAVQAQYEAALERMLRELGEDAEIEEMSAEVAAE